MDFQQILLQLKLDKLKKQFRKLSLVYHPDKTKLPAEEAKAEI